MNLNDTAAMYDKQAPLIVQTFPNARYKLVLEFDLNLGTKGQQLTD